MSFSSLYSQQQRIELEVLRCVDCGVVFGIDAIYAQESLHELTGGILDLDDIEAGRDGTYCCPNGHRQQFTRKRSECYGEAIVKATNRAEQAEAKVEELTKKLADAESELERLRGGARSRRRSSHKSEEHEPLNGRAKGRGKRGESS